MTMNDLAKKTMKLLGENYICEAVKVRKNNTIHEGIKIVEINSEVATILYPRKEDDAYSIRDEYFKHVDKFDGIKDFKNYLMDWSSVKDNLYVRIVENADYAADFVNWKVCNVYAIPYVLAPAKLNGTVNVTAPLLKSWGITEEKLREIATANTTESAVLYSLASFFMNKNTNLLTEWNKENSSFNPEQPGFYFLTNKKCLFGAGCILSDKVNSILTKMFPKGYYILFSSIHEVLIAPHSLPKDELIKTVSEANAQILDPEDALPCLIYEYKDGHLIIS